MQLAYIWVSNFRNIHNQGYNFSSKANIDYDSERNSLKIELNPSYIQQFFGSGISNITGIVGQNASGKTNLLELINYVMDGGNIKIANPFLVLFEDRGSYELVIHKLNSTPEVGPEQRIAISEYDGKIKKMDAVYYSNIFDNRRHNFGKQILDVSTNKLFQVHTENIEQNIKRDVKGQLDFLSSNDIISRPKTFSDVLDQNNLVINPTHIQLISPTWTSINYRAKQFDQKFIANVGRGPSFMQQFCSSFRKKITDNESANAMLYFVAFILYIDIISSKDQRETGKFVYKDEREAELPITERINSYGLNLLEGLKPERMTNMRINEIFQELTGKVADFLRDLYPDRIGRIELLSSLQQYNFDDVTKFNEGVYSSRRIHFETKFNQSIQKFLNVYLDVAVSSSLSFSIDWGGISAGQKAFLTLFSRLYSIRDKIRTNDVLITIDEGDLYFHPKWQTEYLSRLIDFIPAIFGVNIQLILTTHSPFLVSDLTKNHLIFLYKNYENKSIAISNKNHLKETFGGNIGELYLNTFFLNGSLISQFASDKIEQLAIKIRKEAQYLNQDDLRLIEQIGDEMIKNQLNYLLDDKN